MAVTLTPGNFPVSGSYPQQSGTSIPIIFSTHFNAKFYTQTVLPFIANTDWEGEISAMGDSVQIREIATVAVKRYYKNLKLTYETPQTPTLKLDIDQAFHYAFSEDVIDLKQMDIAKVDAQITDGAKNIKIEVENDIFSIVYAQVNASNQGLTAGALSSNYNLGVAGTPVALSSSNIVNFIIRNNQALDEQNIPRDSNRYGIIPVELSGLLKTSDLKDASLSGDSESMARVGHIGMIDGTNLYVSNNLTSVSDGGRTAYNTMFGHLSALTFAGQMVKDESLTAQDTFGELYRGLFVYGYKLVKNTAMTWGYAYAIAS